MLYLEKMMNRSINSANYITSVNGMIHPDRVMKEHDFLYMLEGSWEIMEEGKSFLMHKDDLLILASGRHHYGEKLCNLGNRHMYFHVLPTKEESRLNREKGIKKIKEDSIFTCDTLLHCQAYPHIRKYFQELITAFWTKDSEMENRKSLIFNLLLCEIIRMQSDSLPGSKAEFLVEEVVLKIQSNPQSFYSAREMADCYYICPRTLNNYFKKVYQNTFYEYQMGMKLEMVCQFLLHQPEAKLHEVAVNFGFYDAFHLSKIFKKRYGESPSAFRMKKNLSDKSQNDYEVP